MDTSISPGIREVFSAQRRIGIQQVAFVHAQPPVPLQQPDGNSSSRDTRIAPTDGWGRVDARKIISQFPDDPFEELGFLAPGKRGQEPFDFMHWFHAALPPSSILPDTKNDLARRRSKAGTAASANCRFNLVRLQNGVALCLALSAGAGLLHAQGVITTVAGTDWIFPGAAAPALAAPIGLPTGLAIDPFSGQPILLDYLNHMAFRLDSAGRFSALAGNGLGGYSGDGGRATQASLLYPRSCTMDRAGNLYISDSEGRALRKISPDGTITTLAGLGRRAPADGLPVADVQFSGIVSIAALPGGDLAVADEALGRIYRISANGVVTRLAGNGPCRSEGDGGPARAANICLPDHLAADAAGNLYFSDVVNTAATPRTRRVRRISIDGQIDAFAGNSVSGRVLNGAKAVDSPMQPYALTADPRGGLLISSGIAAVQAGDEITDIARVTPQGTLEIIPAPGLSRLLVTELAATLNGAIYATSSLPGRLFRLTAGHDAEQIAGSGSFRFGGDGGTASFALLNLPLGLTLDREGNLYVADVGNNRIRRIDPAGTMTTVAGNGERRLSPPEPGTQAIENPLLQPFLMASGPDGRPYFSSSFGLHRLNENGSQTVEPYAAVNPGGLAFNAAGSLFYADRGRGRLLRSGPSTTIGGLALESVIPGNTRETVLSAPFDLAADRAGNLYVSESAGHRVLRIDPAGAVTTFAGNGRSSGLPIPAGPRPATSVAITQPTGLAIDPQDNLLIRSYGHLSRVTPAGQLETIAGIGPSNLGSVVYGDGGLATEAALGATGDVAVDLAGNIFLSEVDNNRVRKILAAPPAFQASTERMELTAVSGGAPSTARTLTADGEIPGLAFTLALQTGDSGEWLRASAVAGVTPRAIQISADPAALATGVYNGTIEISVPLGRPRIVAVKVRLQVSPPQPPDLRVDKNTLSFSYPKTAMAREQSLLLSNAGSGPVPIDVSTPEGSFLRVSPANGIVTPAQPLQVSVTADPTGRTAGLYRSSLTIRGAGVTRQVAVTMMVSDRERAILLSQNGLSFQAVAGGGIAPPQSFGVLNPGNGVMPWRLSTSTLAGGPDWLLVSQASGATDASGGSVPSVDVRIDQAGLTPGIYHGLVHVESDEAANSPQLLPVFLEVLPPDAQPGSVVQPAELTFRGVAGQPIGSQELTVFNLTGTPVAYRSAAPPFAPAQPLQYAPIDAIVAPGEPRRMVLQPQAQSLKPGVHRSELSLQFADGTVRRVDINVVIRAAEEKDGVRTADSCTAKRLIPSLRSLGQGASVPAGWPAAVSVEVNDDCGAAHNEGVVFLSFSNGDPPLRLESLKEGKWQGTWASRNSEPGSVTVRVTAENPQTQLRGEVESTADLRASDSPPTLTEEGVLNAPLAPGGLIELSGERFTANQTLTATLEGALPVRLGETEVLIGGRRAPLFSASAGRIVALAPLNLAPNTRQQVLVRRGSTYTRAAPVNVAAAQPAIVLSPQGGENRALARVLRAGEEPFWNRIQTPARTGDRIVLYCSGLGAVDDSAFIAGELAKAPAARTLAPVVLRVGGVSIAGAQVEASLAPGEIGRYQITFPLPAGIPVGDGVEIGIEASGQTSAAALIAVR